MPEFGLSIGVLNETSEELVALQLSVSRLMMTKFCCVHARRPGRTGSRGNRRRRTRADEGKFAGFPTIERVLPVLVTMTDQERFDLGVEILLDGLTQRLSGQHGHR